MIGRVATRSELIRRYEEIVRGIDEEAANNEQRAYGGVVRAKKGSLLEDFTPHIVHLAWKDCGGNAARLTIGDVPSYKVRIRHEYINQLPQHVSEYINKEIDGYYFKAQVDRHIFVDHNLVMGIECKAYAENAMLKRILVDFRLLKSVHPDLICCLLQLESQLGGDYSETIAEEPMGSTSSHTLMSFFPEVNLNVFTLLQGERKVSRPIHKAEFYKPLKREHLDAVIYQIAELLSPHV